MAGDSMEVTNTAMTINLTPGDFRIYTDLRLPKPDLSVTVQPVAMADATASRLDVHIFPNPFTQQTSMSFEMAKAGEVSQQIYDLMGKLVWQENAGRMAAGEQALTWDGRGMHGEKAAAGTYIFKIQAADKAVQGKVVLAD